jgi:protein-S-isoprenylcysteine O-methyltransferase Ste14
MKQSIQMYLFIFGEELLVSYIPMITLNFTSTSSFVILIMGVLFVLGILLAQRYALPSLRSEFKSSTRKEDKYLMLFGFFTFLILICIISFGYKKRQPVSMLYIAAGAVLRVIGYAIKLWAIKTNSFLPTSICIQKDDKVIDLGPYAFARHPFYISTSLVISSLPLIYGSIVGFCFSLIYIIHKIIKIDFEERVLLKQLDGYFQYTQKVKYLLFPFIY